MQKPHVTITGIGAVTPLGTGWQLVAEAAQREFGVESTSKAAHRQIFPTTVEIEPLAASLGVKSQSFAPSTLFLLGAATDALKDFGTISETVKKRTSLVVENPSGTSWTVMKMMAPVISHGARKTIPSLFTQSVANASAGEVARRLGLHAFNIVSTGGNALGFAMDLLRDPEVDLVMYCGLHKFLDEHFQALNKHGVLGMHCVNRTPSNTGANPFVGEGAVALILERRADAELRNAKQYAGISSAACGPVFLRSSVPPTPNGWGQLDAHSLAAVLNQSLGEANISPMEVKFCCGSENGHPDIESAELGALQLAGCGHVRRTSVKKILGEAFGMAFPASLALTASFLDSMQPTEKRFGGVALNIELHSFGTAAVLRSVRTY